MLSELIQAVKYGGFYFTISNAKDFRVILCQNSHYKTDGSGDSD